MLSYLLTLFIVKHLHDSSESHATLKVLLAAAADVIKLKSEPGMAANMREKKTQQFYSMEIKLLILTTQLKETGF